MAALINSNNKFWMPLVVHQLIWKQLSIVSTSIKEKSSANVAPTPKFSKRKTPPLLLLKAASTARVLIFCSCITKAEVRCFSAFPAGIQPRIISLVLGPNFPLLIAEHTFLYGGNVTTTGAVISPALPEREKRSSCNVSVVITFPIPGRAGEWLNIVS